jgi:hypothetical protein
VKTSTNELARAWDNFRRLLPARFKDIEQPLHHAFYCGAWTMAKGFMDAAGNGERDRLDALLAEVHTYMQVMHEAAEEDDRAKPRTKRDISVS